MKKLNINELPEFILLNGDGYTFNTNELIEIKAVEATYKIRQSIAKLVAHFVKYKMTDWLDRIVQIKSLGNTITENRYILLMGEIEGRKTWSKISNKKKDSQTEKAYILKHGEKKGKAIWDEMNNKRGESAFRLSYWLDKGMSEKEATEKISSLSKKGSLVGNKVQEDLRKVDYVEWAKKMPNTKAFYLKQGFTETESELFVADRQTTFSKKICIKKLGKIEGTKRWEERQEKWMNTLDSKTDAEKFRIKKAKIDNRSWCNVSKESLLVFQKAKDLLDNIGIKYNLGVEGNKEYIIHTYKKSFSYDFVIPDLGLAFEYNGEKFHPNPVWLSEDRKKWDVWTQLYSKKDAETCYDFDKVKNLCFKASTNWELHLIWSSDGKKWNSDKVFDLIYEKIKSE